METPALPRPRTVRHRVARVSAALVCFLAPPALLLAALGRAAGLETLSHRPYWFAALGLTALMGVAVAARIITQAWTREPAWRLALLALGMCVFGTYAGVPVMNEELWLAWTDVPDDVRVARLGVFRDRDPQPPNTYRRLIWEETDSGVLLLLATDSEVDANSFTPSGSHTVRYECSHAWRVENGQPEPAAAHRVERRERWPSARATYWNLIPEFMFARFRKLGDSCVWGQEHTIQVAAAGGSPARTIRGAGRVDDVDESPTGRWLAYLVAGWLNRTPRLVVTDVRTGRTFPITEPGSEGAIAQFLGFSPDETMLAAWYRQGDQYEACVVVLPPDR